MGGKRVAGGRRGGLVEARIMLMQQQAESVIVRGEDGYGREENVIEQSQKRSNSKNLALDICFCFCRAKFLRAYIVLSSDGSLLAQLRRL